MSQDIERRAMDWLLNGNTGSSSKTLCAHMLGLRIEKDNSRTAPADGADRFRCVELLMLIPEWVERLDEMADETDMFWGDTWAESIPLIRGYIEERK